MPADPSRIGTGRRRQGDTEPDRTDDSNHALDRALAADAERQTEDVAYDRAKQAGASGDQPPHENVKPGTRLDLEQSDPN